MFVSYSGGIMTQTKM